MSNSQEPSSSGEDDTDPIPEIPPAEETEPPDAFEGSPSHLFNCGICIGIFLFAFEEWFLVLVCAFLLLLEWCSCSNPSQSEGSKRRRCQ